MELLAFWDGEIPADYEVYEERFYYRGRWKHERKRPIYVIHPKTAEGVSRFIKGSFPKFKTRADAEAFRKEQLRLAEIWRHEEDRKWLEEEVAKLGYTREDNEGISNRILIADIIHGKPKR